MRTRCRAFALGALVVVVAGSTPLQGQHAMRMGDGGPARTVLDGPVDVALVRYNGWPLVEAAINGQGPFSFVFDTGAAGLLIADHVASRLSLSADPSLPEGARVKVAGPGGEGLAAEIKRVASVRIGALEMHDTRALVLPLPFPSHVAGVLGMGLFKDTLVDLDFPAARVRVRRGALGADESDVFSFKTRTGVSHPEISLKACGHDVTVVVDTGMAAWFRFGDEMTRACGLAFGPVAGPPARHVDREVPTSVGRLKGDVRVGSLLIRAPHGHLVKGDEMQIVGNRVLERAVLTLDVANKRLRIAPASAVAVDVPSMRSAGFTARAIGEAIDVVHVVAGSSAERAGIGVGDRLVAIDGRAAAEVFNTPAWDRLLERREVPLRVQRGSQPPREVVVQPTVLVP